MMDLYIMDQQLEIVDLVEGAESKVWRRSFADAGDFEIYTADTEDNRALLQEGYYVIRRDDDMVGVIESVEQIVDDDEREMLLVSGRCAKSLFARRVIYPQQTFAGTVWNRMYWMLYNNAVNPSDERRKIPNTAIADYDGVTAGPSAQTQHTGTNLMDAVCDLVSSNNLGWQVSLIDGTFTAALIAGTDRTVEQDAVEPVIFAREYNNILSSSKRHDVSSYANVAAIAGAGEGTARTWTGVDATGTASGTYSGLDRYEMFVDARDIQRTSTDTAGNEVSLTEAQYIAQLQARGLEKLTPLGQTESVDCDIDTQSYQYRVDYNVGDLISVKVDDTYANARIDAVEEIEDSDGYTATPELSDYVLSDFTRTFTDEDGAEIGFASSQAGRVSDAENETVNVSWYGAVGDAATDCTAAIQQAIDDAFASGRMRVYLPAGTYVISAPLRLTTSTDADVVGQRWWDGHGVQLVGDSRSTTIIKKVGAATWQETDDTIVYDSDKEAAFMQQDIDAVLILSGSGTGVVIRDLYVYNTSDAEDAYGIYGSRSGTTIERVNVHAAHGINLYAFYNRLSDIRYKCTSNALTIKNGTSSVVEKMFVSGCEDPYILQLAYSTVSALAADSCTGVIYDLFGTGLVLNGCGTESSDATYPINIRSDSNITINGFYCWQIAAGAQVIHFNGNATAVVNGLSMLMREQLTSPIYLVGSSSGGVYHLVFNGFSVYPKSGVDNSDYIEMLANAPAAGTTIAIDGVAQLIDGTTLTADYPAVIMSAGTPNYTEQFDASAATADTRTNSSNTTTAAEGWFLSNQISCGAGDVIRCRYASADNVQTAQPIIYQYKSSGEINGNGKYNEDGYFAWTDDGLEWSYTVTGTTTAYIIICAKGLSDNAISVSINEEISAIGAGKTLDSSVLVSAASIKDALRVLGLL